MRAWDREMARRVCIAAFERAGLLSWDMCPQALSWVGFGLLVGIGIVELLSCNRRTLTWLELWFEMTLYSFFRLVVGTRDSKLNFVLLTLGYGRQGGKTLTGVTGRAPWKRNRIV